MTSETEYFAVLWDGDDDDRPRAVIRRRRTPDGMEEEILRADGTWEGSDVLVEISRETVDSVKVDSQADGHHVTITSHSDGVTGTLSATVTPAGVRLHDSLLRS